jgi:hypothetical protein
VSASVDGLGIYRQAPAELGEKRRVVLDKVAEWEARVWNAEMDLVSATLATQVASVDYDEVRREHALVVAE